MRVTANSLAGPYDLVIAGAGPASLTLARQYASLTDKRALIVESGPERKAKDNPAQQLAKVVNHGDLSPGYYNYHSQRYLGGSSNVWAGLCATLERRSFLNNEWPITYDELNQYYPAAAEILQLPPEVHTAPEAPLDGKGDLVYRPLHLGPRPPVRFNADNAPLMDWLVGEQEQVSILFNHTVTSLLIEQGQCAGLVAQPTDPAGGGPITINAERTVVAGGGIQNARLLLLSLPAGHALPVGNYFSTHPHINPDHFGQAIIDGDALQAAAAGYSGIFWTVIALSSEFCLENGLLSAAFVGPWEHTAGQRNLLGKRKGTQRFQCLMRTDMAPVKENRIALSATEKDPLGQPATQIHFKFPRESIERIHQAMAERLVKTGLGRISPLAPDWKANSGGGHMLGATRMGSSPDTSVVDRDCKVHGIGNLYVAGSSVFAAGEIANPTYTIVALALRLASHLARNP